MTTADAISIISQFSDDPTTMPAEARRLEWFLNRGCSDALIDRVAERRIFTLTARRHTSRRDERQAWHDGYMLQWRSM